MKNSATLSAAESTPRSLYDAILGGTNSLNFIRFVLASSVIVAHSAPLIKYNAGILGIPAPIYIDSLGHWAVNLFFCISGFLIAHSAQRGTVIGYLKRRALRIFPGYWVSLLFVVFVCGPISVATGHASDPFSLRVRLDMSFETLICKLGRLLFGWTYGNPVVRYLEWIYLDSPI